MTRRHREDSDTKLADDLEKRRRYIFVFCFLRVLCAFVAKSLCAFVADNSAPLWLSLKRAFGMSRPLTVSLTLVRPGDDGLEIFWARRRPSRRFLGGFHAFFAGSVEESDECLTTNLEARDDAVLRAAALRECFEECGALITTEGVSRVERGARTNEALAAAAPLAASRLHLFGWWNTPDWLTPSFSTAFFGLLLTEDEGRHLDDLAHAAARLVTLQHRLSPPCPRAPAPRRA